MTERFFPRLLTRKQAKELFAVDPYELAAPLYFGKRPLWDKVVLNEALDERKPNRRTAQPLQADTRSEEVVEDELERARKRFKKGAVSGR